MAHLFYFRFVKSKILWLYTNFLWKISIKILIYFTQNFTFVKQNLLKTFFLLNQTDIQHIAPVCYINMLIEIINRQQLVFISTSINIVLNRPLFILTINRDKYDFIKQLLTHYNPSYYKNILENLFLFHNH